MKMNEGGKIACFWWASHSGWGNRINTPPSCGWQVSSLCWGIMGPHPRADIRAGWGKACVISAVSQWEARHSRQQEQHAKSRKHKHDACSGNWGCPGGVESTGREVREWLFQLEYEVPEGHRVWLLSRCLWEEGKNPEEELKSGDTGSKETRQRQQ